MTIYEVVYEPTATGASAYVPALPGVIAAGSTMDEVRRLMREAIAFHLEGIKTTEPYAIVDAMPKFANIADVQAAPSQVFMPLIVTVGDGAYAVA